MGRRGQTQSNSSTNADAEAFSIWRDLHQRLTHLAALQDRLPSSIEDSTQLKSDSEGVVGSIESLLKDTAEEEAILGVCVERLYILIALRDAPFDPPQQGRVSRYNSSLVRSTIHHNNEPSRH